MWQDDFMSWRTWLAYVLYKPVSSSSSQVFDQVYILTLGGPGVDTTTLVFYTYQNGFTYFHMGYAATISTVLFLLIMVVTLAQFVLQKRWVHYEV